MRVAPGETEPKNQKKERVLKLVAADETTILVQDWYRGSRDALERLLTLHLDWIHSRVRQRLGPLLRSRVESVDVVQEVSIDFLQYGPLFQPANGIQFRRLLATVVESRIRDLKRQHSRACRDFTREKRFDLDVHVSLDPASTPSAQAEQREREARALLALNLLEPAESALLICRDYESQSFCEIGRALDIAEDAARMRYKRAQTKVRAIARDIRKGQVDKWLSPD